MESALETDHPNYSKVDNSAEELRKILKTRDMAAGEIGQYTDALNRARTFLYGKLKPFKPKFPK